MNLLLGYADRVLFGLALIVGLMLPRFVDLYTEQLTARHQQLVEVLDRDNQRRERNNHAEMPLAVLQEQTRARYDQEAAQLQPAVAALQQEALPPRLWYLAWNLDRPLANVTLAAQRPTIGYNTASYLCGLLLATLASLAFWLLRKGIALLLRRLLRGTRGPRAEAEQAPAPPSPVVETSKRRSASGPVRREPGL